MKVIFLSKSTHTEFLELKKVQKLVLFSVYQGGRKVILDGGSLFIGRNFENGFFPLFQFFYSIKAKKMGAPRDTRGPQFRPPWS